jgi:hypothetical protein
LELSPQGPDPERPGHTVSSVRWQPKLVEQQDSKLVVQQHSVVGAGMKMFLDGPDETAADT